MQAFWISGLAVAVAEIGDKTQLLALLLAARFGRPWPIIAGMAVATLANHAAAGALGLWLAQAIDGPLLRWGLGLSFLAMGGWMLWPDSLPAEAGGASRFGPFLVTLVTFFLAEIGDKTQLATVALAARFDQPAAVVLGSTAGLLAADLPAVLIGQQALRRLPLRATRRCAAALFGLLGIATFLL